MEKILIVEDNKDMRRILSHLIQEKGYQTIEIQNGLEAIETIEGERPDLIILDINLPGKDGMTILEELNALDRHIAVIMLTAYGDIKSAVSAMKLGAFDYITKPFDNEELLLTIQRALYTRQLTREVRNLRKKLGEKIHDRIIGKSRELQEILKQVHLVAPTNMTVLLQGESGTGKELIAQLIHCESARNAQAFIAVDCGAIPESLIESHLFGHEKGAFTGALESKQGIFEQADGGTLFLDEIMNLTSSAQTKFLRVLEEKKLLHVGGRKTVDVDVRIIVSANIELERAVARGIFREDLFHRINEFRIHLPPVRERKGDAILLCRYFLQETSREFDKCIEGFTPEAEKTLEEYFWPGNVREIRNVIRRAGLLCEGKWIMPEHLSLSLEKLEQPEPPEKQKESLSYEQVMGNVEADLIKKTIEQTGGNKSEAAKLLNMSRKTLYRHMKKTGLLP
ncbi:sigma-54-dependent Fis family transcriptional regulator [Candidatus Sumerlaeota bacterium]|nr:sigma-54-dependent Fis family transcriptional regulator [Candidatus Sumerlaeota bacterium]